MAAARSDNRFRILHLPDNIHRSRRDNFVVLRLDHAYPRALALYLSAALSDQKRDQFLYCKRLSPIFHRERRDAASRLSIHIAVTP